ncbi:sensor histidine kinase [Cryobacterium luteum]|uniref:histidine kinase n=1 Tax=Cryobacterium luteum TaxID=1424661 RepID=A0A1H8KWR1_9MICO|nr:HAMP domain-containing sensor histidine kinase [Cryobacterium luteum]TFB84357.1 HAMP domain-containing histidine kinase [Cryobacterium luteum]SEN97362.1 His Kinase A (phospho-acceptor) domain-containing protein [Cryobacterium luteum]
MLFPRPGHHSGRSLWEFQGVVFGALIIVGTAVLLSQPDALNPRLYAAGAGLIALVTLVTAIWRNHPTLQRFSVLLPFADMIGIRVTAHAEGATLSGGALLLILPMIWIAYSHGLRGVLAAIALILVTSPTGLVSQYSGGVDPDNFTRIVAYPLTLLILAGAAGVSGARIRRKKVQLAAQTVLTEQAVRARDDLIEAVTHELRTPLTSILGNAELVLGTHDEQTIARRAGVIVRNAEQMETILADLLHARSTGTALLGLTFATSDLRALIENCLAASRAAADARGVTIDVIASDTLLAEVDPNRIRQVLDNLLTNAIKYNRVGGTVVVSETRTLDTVTFAVTDSGCGMAPHERTLVFEPYYRTASARRLAQQGSGLGLGISRDIARRHGGDLRLVESSSAGSRFELTLPLVQVPVPALLSGMNSATLG